MTTIRELILFCSKYSVGDIITRKEVTEYFKSLTEYHSKLSVSMYFYQLMNNKFIKRIEHGKYTVIKKIPENLASTFKSTIKNPVEKVLDEFQKASNKKGKL